MIETRESVSLSGREGSFASEADYHLTSIRPSYCAFKDVIFGSKPPASVVGVPALLNMQSSLFDRAKIDNVKWVGTILD